jgi:hypothetical protein
MDDYHKTHANALLKMAAYLLTKADERGFTHGEKHHFIQVALSLISDVRFNDLDAREAFRSEVTVVTSDDIPF